MHKKNNSPLNKTLLWLLVGVLSIIVILVALTLKDRLTEFRSLGLLGIFLINFFSSITFFVPAPGIATVFAGGSLYPPLLVSFVATLGAVIGDMGGYLVGLSGKSIITTKKYIEKYEIFMQLFRHWGGVVIFLFALIPNPLFDGVGLVAGGLGYPTRKFFLYLFFGRFIRNILLSFLGHELL